MPKIIDEDEVFAAVIKILVTRGYDRATVQELAAAAKIHEATLFRKYGSKAGLIERAVEREFSKAPLSQVSYTGNLEGDLHAILEAYMATYQEYGEIIPMILLEIPRYPELRNVLETPWANIRGLVDIIERYQSQGLLREEPPLMSVNAFLAPVLLSNMVARANSAIPVPSIDLHDYVEAFLAGRRR